MTRKFSLAKLQWPKLTDQLGPGKHCPHRLETFNFKNSDFLQVNQSLTLHHNSTPAHQLLPSRGAGSNSTSTQQIKLMQLHQPFSIRTPTIYAAADNNYPVTTHYSCPLNHLWVSQLACFQLFQCISYNHSETQISTFANFLIFIKPENRIMCLDKGESSSKVSVSCCTVIPKQKYRTWKPLMLTQSNDSKKVFTYCCWFFIEASTDTS